MKRKLFLGVLSTLVFILLMMSITYNYGRYMSREPAEYGLTQRRIQYIRGDQIDTKLNPKELIGEGSLPEITILTENRQERTLGLYDGRMHYSGMISQREFRSNAIAQTDILNGKQVGDQIDNQVNRESKTNMQSVGTIKSGMPLYAEDFDQVLNLTALDYLGKVIYIDSNQPIPSEIQMQLLDHGYTEHRLPLPSTIEILAWGITVHIYTSSITLMSLLLYVLLLWLLCSSIPHQKRSIESSLTKEQ